MEAPAVKTPFDPSTSLRAGKLRTLLYVLPRYDAAAIANGIHTEVIDVWRAHGVTTEIATLTAGLRGPVSERLDGITVHRLPVSAGLPLKLANRALNLALHYPYFAGALAHYRLLLRARRYDMVHVETAFPLGLVAALTRAHPPLAVTLPGADIMAEPEFDYGYGRFAAVRAALPLVFRRADVLRADSLQLRDLAITRGADPRKVVAIPYNITNDSYPPTDMSLETYRAASRADVCAWHQLDPARPIIVSINRLHPFKGISYIVEALPDVRRAGFNPQVLIVGPSRSTPQFGDYGAFLRQRAAELGVADMVCFTGGIDRALARVYHAAADVGVVASVAESFSRVVIETAAVGTPVVVTSTTGASDYVREAGCGLVVEPRSGPALARALVRLLGDPALWQQLSSHGPAFAADFSSRAIAERLFALYREIIAFGNS